MMDRKTCPKHAEFYSENKFEKLVRLVGFIIRILMIYIVCVTTQKIVIINNVAVTHNF